MTTTTTYYNYYYDDDDYYYYNDDADHDHDHDHDHMICWPVGQPPSHLQPPPRPPHLSLLLTATFKERRASVGAARHRLRHDHDCSYDDDYYCS